MENSARIVCIVPPSIRHARIPETPRQERRATASLRTLRNARRTNDIILTTSIPSLPKLLREFFDGSVKFSGGARVARDVEFLEFSFPSLPPAVYCSNESSGNRRKLAVSSSAFVTKGGRKEGRKKEREEEDILDSSRMHRGSSRDQPRSSKRDYEKGGGCLNSWHRRLIHN